MIDNKYLVGNKTNRWFPNDLEYLMKEPINTWIYGHNHSIMTKRINGVYCGLNAYGYQGENKSDMITNMMFTI